MRRFPVLFLAVLLALALSSCKADSTVVLQMRSDGSGVVRVHVSLDEAAVRAIEAGGGKLEERIRLSDLRDASWSGSRWRRSKGKGAKIEITKSFARPEQVAGIVGEIAGEHGPIRSLSASRQSGLFAMTFRTRGVMDLERLRLGIAMDAALVERLVAAQADPAVVEAQLQDALRTALKLRVTVAMPGAHQTWSASSKGSTRFQLTSEVRRWDNVALVVAGLGTGLLALAFLFRSARGSEPT